MHTKIWKDEDRSKETRNKVWLLISQKSNSQPFHGTPENRFFSSTIHPAHFLLCNILDCLRWQVPLHISSLSLFLSPSWVREGAINILLSSFIQKKFNTFLKFLCTIIWYSQLISHYDDELLQEECPFFSTFFQLQRQWNSTTSRIQFHCHGRPFWALTE